MTLRMLDLFSGIGGFSYAGEKLVGGYETVAFCEYDKHCQKVLRKHWPDTEIIDDVRELANDADRFRGLVDIVVGGYPCQPFSTSGLRRGDKDDRHLWPEMLRIIQAVRPTWVIGENVAGHISMGLDTVLSDLEAEGYQTRCFVIPAVAADAPHRRDRCWVIGRAKTVGDTERKQWGAAEERRLDVDGPVLDRSQGAKEADKAKGSSADVSNTDSQRLQGVGAEQQHAGSLGLRGGETKRTANIWEPEPAVGRVANGIPGRIHRLKQLGNSIVPQVAAQILWAIREAHDQTTV